MAPAPDVPVVQFIQFRANDRCMADPSLFQAVRDTAQGWQEKGLKAQFWGTSVTRPNEFYWLLFWQSHAHSAAIKADPRYPTYMQDRDALVAAPIYEVHVHFSGNPLRALEAPVTLVVYYKMDDGEVNPDSRPAAETQEMMRRVTCLEVSLKVPGFVAISWGVATEDGTRGVNLGGWESIEDHMRLGMLDGHEVFVEETEEVLKSMTELIAMHIHFRSHTSSS